MPSEHEHLQIIAQNHQALMHLSRPVPATHTEWCVVIIYYMAFHYINAYLARKHDEHPASHAMLTPWMGKIPLKDLYAAYRSLEDDSRGARYYGEKLSVKEINKSSLPRFNKIQASVMGWLKVPPAKSLDLSFLFPSS